MKKFTRLEGIAVPLPIANIDTDQILPSAYLKGTVRTGLGRGLLAPLRYDEHGRERPDFVLNRQPWRQAQILVARENFGCGSSREHAPWSLADFGIRCIIAPNFAEIFENNCFKNGILPLRLDPDAVEELLVQAAHPNSARFTIDLEAQKLRDGTGRVLPFSIEAERRGALLEGLDEIGRTMGYEAVIEAYERKHLPDLMPIPPVERWAG